MAITFHAEIKDLLLVIEASGCDENLQQVIDYGCSVIDLAVNHGSRYILCDERNIEYALDTCDTFLLAQKIAECAQKIFRVAIVCGPKFLEDGKFWETVAVNRFLEVRVDTDMERAKEWLLSNID